MTVNAFMRILLISFCSSVLFPSLSPAGLDKVRVVMEDNYPPFVFKDSAGNPQGSQIDLWRLWEKKTGIKTEITLMDWAEAQRRLQSGEFDVIDKIAKTEQRAKIYDFSDPFSTIEVPAFFLKDISGITGVNSLKGFAVGVQAGDSAIERLNNHGIVNLIQFNNYEEIVLAAKERKVNVMVMDKAPALYFLHKHNILGNYKQSEPLGTVSLHRAVKKGNTSLLATIEQGFRLISPDEFKKIENKWYGSSLGNSLPMFWIISGAGVVCLVVLSLLAWNRALKKSVEKHTAELMRKEEILSKSEEKFRKHIEGSTDVIFTLNAKGDFMFASPAWERHFGYSVDEILGKSFALFVHQDDVYPCLEYLQRILSSGKSETSPPYRVKCADGSWRLFEANGSTFIDPDGALLFIGIGHDITERKKAEEALEESRERYRGLSEAGFEAIFFSEKGICIEQNLNAELMFGYSNSEAIGRPGTDWIIPEDREMVIQHMASGYEDRYEVTALRKDGTTFPALIRAKMMHYKGKDIRVTSLSDITVRKKAEEERLQLERQLLHSQKLESLGVLSGGIAHDFNNLLQAMLGNLDLALIRLPADATGRKNIEQAVNAGKHAAKLTNMMLAYSGKGLFVIKSLSLTELVEENATMLETAISKSVLLDLHLDHDLPPIMADAGQLQQVIMNLITNASEAIGDQGGKIKLSTGIKEFKQAELDKSRLEEKLVAGCYVWMKVCDSGCGMDHATLQKLFDPFFTTKFTGRGLGMSAVLGIIQAHKGAFLIESKPGVGTTIQVLFPIVEHRPDKLAETHPANDENVGTLRRRGVILVVDDEEMIRGVCVAMLEELGFETLAAASGEEALQLFREHGDLIKMVLLDQVMPGMDGITVLRELRRIHPEIKVVLASGFSQQEVAERFKGLGLDGFIPKPFNLKHLNDELLRAL